VNNTRFGGDLSKLQVNSSESTTWYQKSQREPFQNRHHGDITLRSTDIYDMIHIYLLQMGFHPVQIFTHIPVISTKNEI
jgi:hypothetical protein